MKHVFEKTHQFLCVLGFESHKKSGFSGDSSKNKILAWGGGGVHQVQYHVNHNIVDFIFQNTQSEAR